VAITNDNDSQYLYLSKQTLFGCLAGILELKGMFCDTSINVLPCIVEKFKFEI
jgi:hypothetical protein